MIGIVLGRGRLGQERVAAYEDVQTLGRNAIITRAQARDIGAREWHERRIEAHRSRSLKGKRMITRDGREVGTITDIYVDKDTGEVMAYDGADQAFARLVTRHRVLPRLGAVTVCADALNVSMPAVERGEGD